MTVIATIHDPGIISILEDQLRGASISWLDITPEKDQIVHGHRFAIYAASLCDCNSIVFDAWVISGGYNGQEQLPFGGIYNKDNYPTITEALAGHMGRLILDGNLALVEHGKPKRVR